MSEWLETGTRIAFCRPVGKRTGASLEPHGDAQGSVRWRDPKMARARTRTKRSNRGRRDNDDRVTVPEEIRNRRYLAFVRAIVGAARSRNSSR
jgi:hypothetical protein